MGRNPQTGEAIKIPARKPPEVRGGEGGQGRGTRASSARTQGTRPPSRARHLSPDVDDSSRRRLDLRRSASSVRATSPRAGRHRQRRELRACWAGRRGRRDPPRGRTGDPGGVPAHRGPAGPLPPGEAVITRRGRLPCPPRDPHRGSRLARGQARRGGDARPLLPQQPRAWPRAHGLRSVAFPSISTGVYGYPVAEAARVALCAVGEKLRGGGSALDLVRCVLFSDADLATYRRGPAGRCRAEHRLVRRRLRQLRLQRRRARPRSRPATPPRSRSCRRAAARTRPGWRGPSGITSFSRWMPRRSVTSKILSISRMRHHLEHALVSRVRQPAVNAARGRNQAARPRFGLKWNFDDRSVPPPPRPRRTPSRTRCSRSCGPWPPRSAAGARRAPSAPDASLERDLGLGSLERVELLLRLENGLRPHARRRGLEIDTPAGLARAVLDEAPDDARGPRAGAAPAPAARRRPLPAAPTLSPRALGAGAGRPRPPARLPARGRRHRARRHLRAAARRGGGGGGRAARSGASGAGDTVALMLPTGLDFLRAFQGILIAGAVPGAHLPARAPGPAGGVRARGRPRSWPTRGCALLITVDRARGGGRGCCVRGARRCAR